MYSLQAINIILDMHRSFDLNITTLDVGIIIVGDITIT